MKRFKSRPRRTLSTFLQVTRCEDRLTPTLLYGLAGSGLAVFPIESAFPGAAVAPLNITGLNAAETLQAIDFRPATGQLFGLASDNTVGRIGSINLETGAFTVIGAAFTLTGSDFGFDFNPANDRIRVTSNADSNLLIDPNTGVVTVQANLNPGNPNIVASAYNNNFANASATTLYGIDSVSNQLFTQVPATGTLTLVGDLGVDPDNPIGFDVAGSGAAFAAMNIGGTATLFSINLSTGAATSLGAIGSSSVPFNVRGLAVARYVWDGGGGSPGWSTPGNWVGNVAPQAGGDLVFPAGAAQIVDSFNDYSPGTPFNSIVFTGGGYDIEGSGISLTNGLTDIATGGNNLHLNINLTQPQIFSVANAGQTLALGGIISGSVSGTLNKEKPGSTSNNLGTLLFNGLADNTYFGITSVNGGVLDLQQTGIGMPTQLVITNGVVRELANNQIANSAAMMISALGTFDLNGFTDTTGQITVVDGTVITNGGKLTVSGNVDLNTNAKLLMRLVDTTNSDLITVFGSVTVGGALQLNSSLPVPAGSVIVLINNDGVDPVNGTFAGLAEGAIVVVNGVGLRITYVGGDGNDVSLSVASSQISGSVFEDRNGDGTQTPGTEPGMIGVRVFDDVNGNGKFDAGEPSTLTDDGGNYTLTFTIDGAHVIRQVPPTNTLQTTPNPPTITLKAGQTVSDINFGNFKTITISGTVFDDANDNGIFDPGEHGIPMVSVAIDFNADGINDAIGKTDSAGFYIFGNLGPGNYRIRQIPPPNTIQTTPNPADIAAISGSNITNVDFGNHTNRAKLLAVGAGQGGGPNVKVYNADGSLRFSFFAYDPAFAGGVSVATGDVNGDGIDDIITGAGPGGGPHVKVFDGANLNVLQSFFAYSPAFTGGVNVATGDFNQDGRDDIVTGAGAGGGPHVIVYEAVNLYLLASFYAYDPSFAGGVNVAAGDVTGDEVADVVTGAGPGGGPHVKVFDIRNNTTVFSFFAYMDNFMGGVFVAAGDVNDDGRADIMTGGGFCAAPSVKVFNGATGQIMRLINAYDPAFMGGVRVGAVDLDGNGVFDVITGAGPTGGPNVKTFRGDNGAELSNFFAFDPAFMGGVFVG